SRELVDPQQIPRWIAERTVTYAVVLVRRLLEDLGSRRLDLREGGVEIIAGQRDGGVVALRDQVQNRASLFVADRGIGSRWMEHDRRLWLLGWADRDPAHVAVTDVLANLEAQHVPVESERVVRIGVWKEGVVNDQAHAKDDSGTLGRCASSFLTGLDTCFAMHGGIPALPRSARAR